MTHTPKGLLALAIALTLFLSAGSVVAHKGKGRNLRAAVEAGVKQFMAAFNRADAAGLAAMYTANAQVFPPNSDIVTGREAIQKLWQGVMDSGIKGLTIATLEVQGSGDMGYEVGKYTLMGEGGKVLDTGKYIIIFKRENGQWKLHRDIWNTSKPPPKK